MGLPRQLVGEVRRLNDSQLRQLLILARGLLLDAEEPVLEISDIPGMPAVRYRQRTVTCGKATCTGCPHGPYWYAHWTEDGRKRSQYIGSELPTAVRHKIEALAATSGGHEDAPRPARAATGGPADRGGEEGTHAGRLRLVRGDRTPGH